MAHHLVNKVYVIPKPLMGCADATLPFQRYSAIALEIGNYFPSGDQEYCLLSKEHVPLIIDLIGSAKPSKSQKTM
jgi:hypothetical protein